MFYTPYTNQVLIENIPFASTKVDVANCWYMVYDSQFQYHSYTINLHDLHKKSF